MRFWMVGSWVVLVAMMAGCASNPQRQEPPPIQRISEEELEKLLPKPDPNLTYEELVRLTREGMSAEQIIEKIKASHSSYMLTPTQALELSKQGVSVKVLDYIQASREQALRDSFAEELGKRDREHRVEVERLMREMQLRSLMMRDPFWGPYPPYWRYPYYRR